MSISRVLREAIASAGAGGQEHRRWVDGGVWSASAAVRCAVSMQQLFERRYRRAEQQLHIRIGLGAGESTVQDGDYFGMPSIEAARLCDKAPSDGILVSSAGEDAGGSVDGVEFESVGELELKGFPEPVEAFAVPWAPLGEEGDSAWSLAVAGGASFGAAGLVCGAEAGARGDRGGAGPARGGARQVVLLSGEPGIGKTRLAAYAAHAAHAEGFVRVLGACSEELAVPYEPWIEVCSQLVEHAPAGSARRVCGASRRRAQPAGAQPARGACPALPAPQTSDPETERFLLFSAVAGLLAEIARPCPCVWCWMISIGRMVSRWRC